MRALVERAAEALGRLDVLINMASVYRCEPFDETDEARWDERPRRRPEGRLSLRARGRAAHARAPAAAASSTSATGWRASGRPRYNGYLPYYVAKRGVIGLTEALALELAADRSSSTPIAPGPILAPPDTSDDELKAVEAATPLGRWGGEAEIAKAVRLAARAGLRHRETIRVDGGRHVK